MIAELGHFFLIFALALSIVLSILPLAGYFGNSDQLMKMARPATICLFFLVAGSFAVLSWGFVINDFSISYVVANSNSKLPLIYRISGVWGAHEGSLLLWIMSLTAWSAAVAITSRTVTLPTKSIVLAVLAMISTGFLLFVLFTSNPFVRTLPPSIDGRDLNPLLQDPGLAIHPPLLYMGYVGFAVAFAFAIAALVQGKLDDNWARSVRPWVNAAWSFLTLGIAVGSWWAYYELGWGGWWFWDPVENASFMPWLTGTAMIHSLAVTEQRQRFKSWTLLLAILTFSLSLLGTFIVRSGIITSVHAFANDPERGLFILLLLLVTIGGSLLLYALRAHTISSSPGFHAVSRESALLANNLLLVVTAASILLGTVYPIALDALNLDKISVGAPYFNKIFIPLMAPLALLVGFGSFAYWRKDSIRRIVGHLGLPFLLSMVSAAFLPFLFSAWHFMAFFGSWLASWIIISSFVNIISNRHNLGALPVSFYCMILGHIGMALFIFGVTYTSLYSIEKNFSMVPGDAVRVADFEFRFQGIEEYEQENYKVREGIFDVRHDGIKIDMPAPQKRFYPVQRNTTTEAAISSGLFYDLYVALGEPIDEDTQNWSVRINYKMFVNWIWFGALVMALAAMLENADKRYRSHRLVQGLGGTKR